MPNVWVLTLAQAMNMSSAPLMVFIGGILGSRIAPDPSFSTLPVAFIVVGTALSTVPVVFLMRRFGRKPVMLVGALWSACMAMIAAFAVAEASFWGFCLSSAGLGCALAVVQQYRFAAMESVPVEQAGKAASRVLLGGLIAAYLGPELVVFGRIFSPNFFVAALILLGCINILAFLLLTAAYKEPVVETAEDVSGGRRLSEIITQPVLWAAVMAAAVGYALMSFIMTATPLSMHVLGEHSLADTKWVIQSHIMAMYLPSLISGYLIARFGLFRLIVAGLVALAICITVAESGESLMHYWSALVLLGIGWNFMFIGGTALLPESYRPQERYRVQALNEFTVFGSQAIAALCSGWVIHTWGWNGLLLICLPFLLLQFLVLSNWRRSIVL